MEPDIYDLMVKIKTIAEGPNADLLHKLVNILYEREHYYSIHVDLLRDVTPKLKAIKDLCKAIESQQNRISESEVFDIVGRISAAARMALDNLNDPILHNVD